MEFKRRTDCELRCVCGGVQSIIKGENKCPWYKTVSQTRSGFTFKPNPSYKLFKI